MAGGGAVGLLQALLSTDNDIRSKAEVGVNFNHLCLTREYEPLFCRRVMRLCRWNRG